jgi:hypothetical protein
MHECMNADSLNAEGAEVTQKAQKDIRKVDS